VKGIFSEPIVRKMAKKADRPIIFPLSNPTSHSEAEPPDLIAWTEGRALVATGSPFAPVKYNGKTIEIAQSNNVFIFPAVGLGVVGSRARRVTDKMLLAAAKALGNHSPALQDPTGFLLPRVKTIRAENLFSQDDYVLRRHLRSVLCLPLVKQAKLIGVLYLENNLAPRVFTPDRLAMLELLASQAAISLDTFQYAWPATLYF
jgi:Malic enzyme, NAD binding domain/GAF domain